jgi:hypothetical protein
VIFSGRLVSNRLKKDGFSATLIVVELILKKERELQGQSRRP